MTLKQFIFDKLEKGGYISDQQVYDFLGYEPNYMTIEAYKASYHRLKREIEFFEGKNILSITKARGRYFAEIGKGKGYYISKEYKNYLERKENEK